MELEFKPDLEEVLERYEAWWERAIVDRPLVSIDYPRPAGERVAPPEKRHATIRDRWMDTEYVVDCAEARMANSVSFADSLPVVFPNLGPEVFSAFYGCEMEYGEHTAWSKPTLDDLSPESVAGLRMDRESFYFHKTLEISDALVEAGRGRFIVGYTDLHGGGDAIAALREPQELLLDTIENPEGIKALCERMTGDFLEVYDLYHDRLSAAGMPSTTWLNATCRGKFHVPSNDFSCMISDGAFEDLFLPGIVRECRHMDRNIYHLDGPQALRYLDTLLEVPEIHAIEWVPGAGRDYWADSIEVYRRIQAGNKALQILAVPAADLDLLFDSLAPEGVWVSSVPGVSDRAEAEAVLARFAKWTGRS